MSAKPSLKELGYRFNQKGEFRTINDNAPFVFTNQADYERIGDAMTMELYGMLGSVCGLRRIEVPVKVEDKNGGVVDFPGFVFASPEFQEKSTVLLIIHGSGAVRPGQWSRRLILNENLEVGSQIPYIRRALVNDWGVVVCSTNTDKEFRDYARHHLCAVYEQLLKDSTIQRFFVVAHSRGGPDIAQSLPHFKNENRFELVCLTDSIGLDDSYLSTEGRNNGGTVFINWKADSKLQSAAIAVEDILEVYSRVHQVYAGTTEHERSSHTAFDSVFHVLERWKGPDSLPKLLVEAAGLTSVSGSCNGMPYS
ncbi:hypothetical protein Y032_0007g3194 [Ancylostoma ceylanicum]|uniref:Arb2 domain-containing protein n=1 Tax=Ancylostoma ceylanicum TaxID=53326 RepID=A0A016VLS5_9BILA|nr:hypothetical protein Y032_0007g3194 [Ancylostoma ceylanicum]